MTLTITVTQHGKKTKRISITVDPVLTDMRTVWEAEQVINRTAKGANVRLEFSS